MSWVKNDVRRAAFLQLLSPGPDDKILDVGAGKGEVAALVQQTGLCDVYALDPDKKRIGLAQKTHPNVKTCVAGSESIPYEGGFFDKVYSTMAVHHFADQEKSFKEIARVLRSGGVLVVLDISSQSFLGRLGGFLGSTVTRSHLRFLNRDELVAMLGREGEFVVREAKESGQGYLLQAVKREASV